MSAWDEVFEDRERRFAELAKSYKEKIADGHAKTHEWSSARAKLESQFAEQDAIHAADLKKVTRFNEGVGGAANENARTLSALVKKTGFEPQHLEKREPSGMIDKPDYAREQERLLRAYGHEFSFDMLATAQRATMKEHALFLHDTEQRKKEIANTPDPKVRAQLMKENEIAGMDHLAFTSKRIVDQAENNPGLVRREDVEKFDKRAKEAEAESIRLRQQYKEMGIRKEWQESYARSLESAERGREQVERTSGASPRTPQAAAMQAAALHATLRRDKHEDLVHQTAYGNDPSMAAARPPRGPSGRSR